MVQHLPVQAGTLPVMSETIFTEMGTKPDLEKVKSFLRKYLPVCHFPIAIFCANSLKIKKTILDLRDGQNQCSKNKLLHWMSGIILKAVLDL